ncbi:hypothetical protein NUACC21_56920 [Scytonema sp. NUACC21]
MEEASEKILAGGFALVLLQLSTGGTPFSIVIVNYSLIVGLLFGVYFLLKRQIRERQTTLRDRKLAEAELRKHAQILDLANDTIIISDLNRQINYWNQGAERLYGWTKQEALGQYTHTFLNTAFPKPLEEIREEFWQTGYWEGELTQTKRDGKQITVASRWTLQRDENHQPVAILEINNDITESKQAELALRESERRFRAIFDNTFQFVGLLSPEGILLEVNQTALNFAGLKLEDVINRPFWETYWWTISPESQKGLQEAIAQARTGKFIRYEVDVWGTDNKVMTGDFSLRPIFNEAGEVVLIIPEGRDISDRKRAEEALKQAKDELEVRVEERTQELKHTLEQLQLEILERQRSAEALYQSEQRYRSLLTASAQVIWIASSEGEAMGTTAGWQEITGQTSEELKGQGWLNAIHAEDRGHMAREWMNAVATRGLYEAEFRLRTKDGGYRDFVTRGVPVFNPDGSVREWVGACTDITERKQAEQALKNLNEELEIRVQERTKELTAEIAERREGEKKLERLMEALKRSNQELERFAFVAAHDLQEPLRAISGYTQLLAQEYQDHLGPSAQEYMSYIVEGSTRMQQLVRDLLIYHRVSSVVRPLESISCNAILQQVLSTLQPYITETQARVTYDHLPTVTANKTQLIQLFQNLIENAIKFRRPEPPQVHVTAELIANNEWLFCVSDNGIGIKQMYLERIFEIFKRLHTQKRFPGTGIGLAICQKIVEHHGGRIWAESEVGVGTKFYFTIPSSDRPITA